MRLDVFGVLDDDTRVDDGCERFSRKVASVVVFLTFSPDTVGKTLTKTYVCFRWSVASVFFT